MGCRQKSNSGWCEWMPKSIKTLACCYNDATILRVHPAIFNFPGLFNILYAAAFHQACSIFPITDFLGYLLTYMGVFDLAFVSSNLPQLPADCYKWGLQWKPSVTGSYLYPFLHVRLPPAIYLSTNLYGSQDSEVAEGTKKANFRMKSKIKPVR